MKDYGISRLARFENEKSALKSLPVNSFEVVQYKTAKVHTDCHVQIINNFYSIPYRLIGQSVRVKIADRMIEVYNGDYELIARHARMRGRGEFSRHFHNQCGHHRCGHKRDNQLRGRLDPDLARRAVWHAVGQSLLQHRRHLQRFGVGHRS